jgi:hypothetical protein
MIIKKLSVAMTAVTTLVLTYAVILPAAAATIETAGTTTIGTNTDKSDANFMTGIRITTGSRAGTLSGITVRVGVAGNAGNNLYQVAIYSDSNNKPGTRITSSVTGTLTSNSWNTRPVSANLAANTNYWLMYNANGTNKNQNNLVYARTGGISAQSASQATFGNWPSTFGQSNGSIYAYSMYATYSVPDLAPTVSLTSPAQGATVSGNQTVSAGAANAAGVQFSVDGSNLGAEDMSAPFSTSWNSLTATNGSHTVTATARNSDGVTAVSSVTVTVENVPATPPTVSISNPADGSTVSGTQSVTADAADAIGVSGVQFMLDGNNLGAEDTTAPYFVSWDTKTASNATHSLTAVARNGSGLTTSSMVQVTVDNPPVTPSGDGVWRNITPSNLSTDYNNPANNFGPSTIVLDPNDPNVLYVGVYKNGIFKSIDAGASWFKVNTGSGGSQLDVNGMWTLAVDPFDSNIVWTTSSYGNGGPYKSTDGGVSWTKLPAGPPTQVDDVYSIYLDPYTPNHVIMAWHSPWTTDGVNSGVSESTDGGATWINHQPPANSGWGAGNAVWFLDDSQSWLLGSQNGGIWRTTNAGGTWTKVSDISITHGGLNALTKVGTTYYLAHMQAVSMSTDEGVTWTDISAGLPYAYYSSIATDGTYLYTAPSFPIGTSYVNGPWYRRPIAGGSWTAMTNSPNTCRTYNGTTNCNGPVMSAFDATNKIAYTANWNGGLWKLVAVE